MRAVNPQYVVDENDNREAVVLPLSEWEQILSDVEELEDIRAYDRAKPAPHDLVPFGPTAPESAACIGSSEPSLLGGRRMKGVEFLVDESGTRKAVLIDLKKHRLIWEDFYDALRAKEREKEPRESLEEVKRRILRQR